MGLFDLLRDVYHYKIKTVFGLLYRGEFGYLIGVLTEKGTGTNVYLEYLRRRSRNLTIERDIMGHTMTLDLSDPGLSRYLISRGVNEPNATPAFIEALESAVSKHESDDLVFLDIGSNIGYFALLEAEVLENRGTVVAFEPEASNRELLERNVRQNGYEDRVDIRSSAIGDVDGAAELILSDHSNWHRIATEGGGSEQSSVPVDIRRVDSFLTDEDLPAESVIGVRMDVEGYETAIFEGMGTFLNADSPAVLFVELHPSELTDSEVDRLLSDLQDAGFSVRFAGQDREVFTIDDPLEIASVGGSHIRLILQRSC